MPGEATSHRYIGLPTFYIKYDTNAHIMLNIKTYAKLVINHCSNWRTLKIKTYTFSLKYGALLGITAIVHYKVETIYSEVLGFYQIY